MTVATFSNGRSGHRSGRVGPVLVAALLAALAGCGFCGDGFDEVHDQNQANLAYPADDSEATLQGLHDRLAAVTTGAAPGDGQVTVEWNPAGSTGAAGGGDPVASIEVEHVTDRYRFTFETLYDDDFELAAPGLGSFSIVAARYTLEVEGTNLPTIYSQPTADSARADLLAYLASPEAMATHATEKLETLRTQARQWLDLPALRRQFDCETKPGIEGNVTRCRHAELSDAERDQLKAAVDATIDARIAEAQANAAALHPLLVEATLADRCPACWG